MKNISNLMKSKIVFIKYLFSSGFSFVLDLFLFSLFSYLLKNKLSVYIIIATFLARAISSFCNYLLNRNAVFKKNNDGHVDTKSLCKYYILVVIQACVSGLVVSKLNLLFKGNISFLFIPKETIVKIPVEIILFIVNFFIQKWFIFTDEPKKIPINDSLKNLLLAFFTTMSLTVTLTNKNIIVMPKHNTDVLVYFILWVAIYHFYKKFFHKNNSNIPFKLLAVILSIFMVVGYSYDNVGSSSLVFGNIGFIIISIIKLICFYHLFNTAICYLYNGLCYSKFKDCDIKNRFGELFQKHPMIVSMLIILICYLPYIIAFYPAIMGYDPANQIKEFMGMHTRYMDSVILLDPNVTITNFNPVLHTLLLGGCFKFGHLLGWDNLGLFIYSIIQLIILIVTLAYSINYMKKQGVANKALFIILAIYALVPMFPFYGLSTNKDTIFCCFIMLYVIKLYDLIHNETNLKQYISFILCMVMVILTRNNGIYTILLSLPFTLIWLKKKRKAILVSLVVVLGCYIGYNKVLLPSFKISNTSIREMLSIPFQQTARYVKEYPDDFNEHDREVIDKVLEFDTLAERYDPELSDYVKNKYNIYTTSDDLKEYFIVWFKGFLKRPNVYFEATINNIYGYFYPDTSDWYLYYKYNTKLYDAGFDYHYNSLSWLRNILISIGKFFPYIPVIGLFVNIAFVGWIYLFLFAALIVKKEYKYLPFIFIPLSFILVNIAGPANTYFRYALPYIIPLPLTICLMSKIFHVKGRRKCLK